MSFLGHIVERGHIRMDPKKVQAIEEWQLSKDVHDLRSFLGLANYYRRLVKGYSEIARPLTDLLKKTETWNWTPQFQVAFDNLKKAIVTDPVLALPDMSKPFVVGTDTSDFALGGVLMQDGHPVAFESRKLKDVERRYSPKLTSRQARWQELLSEFHFVLEYRAGSSNHAAEALSRRADLASLGSVAASHEFGELCFNAQKSSSTSKSTFEIVTGQHEASPKKGSRTLSSPELKKYSADKEDDARNQSSNLQLELTKTKEKVAEAILNHRVTSTAKRNHTEYLVKWRECSSEENTWEQVMNLKAFLPLDVAISGGGECQGPPAHSAPLTHIRPLNRSTRPTNNLRRQTLGFCSLRVFRRWSFGDVRPPEVRYSTFSMSTAVNRKNLFKPIIAGNEFSKLGAVCVLVSPSRRSPCASIVVQCICNLQCNEIYFLNHVPIYCFHTAPCLLLLLLLLFLSVCCASARRVFGGVLLLAEVVCGLLATKCPFPRIAEGAS
ncbi:UNVERIFIED_CONTAM: Retrovirus-related Pol polyprotein from transposon gypsy [Sesamum indicum]